MSMNVKATLIKTNDNEIRRFCVDVSVASSFAFLEKKVSEIFPSLNQPGQKFTMHWKDEEEDLVSFSSDEELIQGLSSVKDGLFRVFIKEEKSSGFQAQPHPNVVCDVCEKSVVGIRYKCAVCPDYDLCSTCEGQGHHSEHHMIRMCSSQQDRPMPNMWNFPRFVRRHCRQFWRQQKQQQQQGGAAPSAAATDSAEGGAATDAKKQHEEFLQSVGQSVADMLDPLGIDVEVDVENDQQQRQRCHGKGRRGHRHHGGPHHGPAGPWGGWGRGDCGMKCEKPETGEQQSCCPKKDGEVASGSSSDGNEEWTVVTDKENTPKPMEADPPVISETGGRLYPHADPKIGDAMQHLLSMGYNDDNGWLTSLVQSKEGDVNRVLDALKPSQ